MKLHELQYETVYKYMGGNVAFYIYTYKKMIFDRKQASTQIINCLDRNFCTISQNFSFTGNFEEVSEDISEKVKGILGVVDIKEKLFPIY